MVVKFDMTDKDYENMLSVMPYTSVGRLGYMDEQIAETYER